MHTAFPVPQPCRFRPIRASPLIGWLVSPWRRWRRWWLCHKSVVREQSGHRRPGQTPWLPRLRILLLYHTWAEDTPSPRRRQTGGDTCAGLTISTAPIPLETNSLHMRRSKTIGPNRDLLLIVTVPVAYRPPGAQSVHPAIAPHGTQHRHDGPGSGFVHRAGPQAPP